MTVERRSHERRTPPGMCSTCRHPQSDHLEGSGRCQTADCACEGVTMPVRPEPKPRKPRVVKSAAKKK